MKYFTGRTGGSKVVALIMIVVLLIGGYTAWKFIDARIKTYAFEEGCLEVVKYGSGKKEEELVSEVLAAAKEVGVNVNAGQITFKKEHGKLNLKVSYVYDVKPPLFNHTQNHSVDVTTPEF